MAVLGFKNRNEDEIVSWLSCRKVGHHFVIVSERPMCGVGLHVVDFVCGQFFPSIVLNFTAGFQGNI